MVPCFSVIGGQTFSGAFGASCPLSPPGTRRARGCSGCGVLLTYRCFGSGRVESCGLPAEGVCVVMSQTAYTMPISHRESKGILDAAIGERATLYRRL